MIMKRLKLFVVLAAFFSLCSLSAVAAAPGVMFLFKDGTKAGFAFSSKPKITMSAEGLTLSASDKAEASYQFSDVQRYYFVADIDNDAVQTIEATDRHPVFSCANGLLTVRGMLSGERIRVVSISGAVVKASAADTDGTVQIDLSQMASGVYIVATESGVNFKIVK